MPTMNWSNKDLYFNLGQFCMDIDKAIADGDEAKAQSLAYGLKCILVHELNYDADNMMAIDYELLDFDFLIENEYELEHGGHPMSEKRFMEYLKEQELIFTAVFDACLETNNEAWRVLQELKNCYSDPDAEENPRTSKMARDLYNVLKSKIDG